MSETDMNPQHESVKPAPVTKSATDQWLDTLKWMNTGNPVLDAALHYGGVQKIPVFALRPLDKKPYRSGFQESASTDPAAIRREWARFPDARVATVAGPKSGIIVTDLDVKDGRDGFAELRKLTATHGALPRTLAVKTPSRGGHFYFKAPMGVDVRNRAGDIAPGIDVRGGRADGSHGGVIPLPPSPGPNGGRYEWWGDYPGDFKALPEPPPWLLYLMVFNKWQRERLAALNITGPKSFGYMDLQPAQWEPWARALLRDAMRGHHGALPDRPLSADLASPLIRYVESSIGGDTGELRKIEAAAEGNRDSTINDAGMQIWGLLHGLEEFGALTDQLVQKTRDRFLEAASMLGTDQDGTSFIDIAAEKWERTSFDADARDLSHVLADKAPAEPSVMIKATPYQWVDPSTIPPREWVYGRHMIRKFPTATVAPGDTGKTSLLVVEALSIVTGRDLLGLGRAPDRGRVWWWNGEDPYEELQRRIQAACLHYGISRGDIEGRLFVDSGRDMPIVLATQDRSGTKIAVPVADQVKATLTENAVDVLYVDPFVSSHRVTENDNNAIDAVVKEWGRIAGACNAAVDLVHHARKTGGADVTAEDARGGRAFNDGTRALRTLNKMTDDEAKKAGVDNRRLFIRLDSGANRMAPPAAVATWYRLHSVDLGNATAKRPSDNLGVVVPWEWPDAQAGLPPDALAKAQAATAEGQWRKSTQADAWIGYRIGEALGIDAKAPRGNEQLKELIESWVDIGAFVEYQAANEKGRPCPHLKPVADFAVHGAAPGHFFEKET